MTKVSGDGFSVKTEALRSDATKWDEKSSALREGRTSVPEYPCGMPPLGGEVVQKAIAQMNVFLQYCQQGEEAFTHTAESLRRAASDYEKHEKEVF